MALIRFEQEQQEWRERAASIENKYGKAYLNSEPFLKDRLAHLEGIEIRYRTDANTTERLELEIMKGQRREIERSLFPNIFMRLSYRLLQSIVLSRQRKQNQVEKQINLEGLKAELIKRGLGACCDQMEAYVMQGRKEFMVPIRYQVNERESMRLDLHFEEKAGGYHINDCQAALRDELRPKVSGKFSFESVGLKELTTEQAYNLLSGRAIKVRDDWIKLDFNDRDTSGNCRIKIFPPAYGFELEKELDKLKVKETQDVWQRQQILTSLQNGNKISLNPIRKGDMVEIEANPQQLSLMPQQVVEEKRVALQKTEQNIITEQQRHDKKTTLKLG